MLIVRFLGHLESVSLMTSAGYTELSGVAFAHIPIHSPRGFAMQRSRQDPDWCLWNYLQVIQNNVMGMTIWRRPCRTCSSAVEAHHWNVPVDVLVSRSMTRIIPIESWAFDPEETTMMDV